MKKQKNNIKHEEKLPLTLLSEEDGTIILSRTDLVTNLRYTINDGSPVFISSMDKIVIDVLKDDVICFYGEGTHNSVGKNNYFNIKCSTDTTVYGNIMSLLTEDFQNAKEITQVRAFYRLFHNNTHLKNHYLKNLVLPAKRLTDYCYRSMFHGCTSLITAPELPAEILTKHCYDGMFGWCFSLKVPPKLPAQTLAEGCYNYMFYKCSSLTIAPELKVRKLEKMCYSFMFGECTSLTIAPELPAQVLADFCYFGMFLGCSTLTLPPKLTALKLASCCYSNMFTDCISLTTAPELPARTLVDSCYSSMFVGCKNLNYIKCLAIKFQTIDCFRAWLDDVSPSGIFITYTNTQWAIGNDGIPVGWIRKNI